MKKVIEDFDKKSRGFDKRYREPQNKWDYEKILRKMKVHNYVINNFNSTKKINILEIGCGTGNFIIDLLEQNKKWEGIGIDISKGMVDICNSKIQQTLIERLKFENLDFNNFNMDKKFDLIVLLGVIGYLEDVYGFFKKAFTYLKKNGNLIFSYSNKNSPFNIIRCLSFKILDFLKFYKLIGSNTHFSRDFYKGHNLYYLKNILNGLNFKTIRIEHLTYPNRTIQRFIDVFYLQQKFENNPIINKFSLTNIIYLKKVDTTKKSE